MWRQSDPGAARSARARRLDPSWASDELGGCPGRWADVVAAVHNDGHFEAKPLKDNGASDGT